MANIYAPEFTDETAAIAHLEQSRWADSVTCPHCGSVSVTRMAGKTQTGYFQCNGCRDKFTCRTGTVMERSHIPVRKWLLAIHLISSSKNGMSAHELHRLLGVTYKSAWFLAHRIREAMIDANPAPMGSGGGNVQADETYHLNTSKRAKGYKRGFKNKASIMALVDEDTGTVRTFHVEKGVNADKVRNILFTNVVRKATLVTDGATVYTPVGKAYGDHQTINHVAREYVNAAGFTTNNVENFFGMFKRGMRGTYTFCGEQHLQRYLTEFQFRHNNRSGLGTNDKMRAEALLKGVEGKRLTYRRPD
jgi:transposase-like protein